MFALKSARDQMNMPGNAQLRLVMSGSDRDKLLRLVNTAAAPFFGAATCRRRRSTSLPGQSRKLRVARSSGNRVASRRVSAPWRRRQRSVRSAAASIAFAPSRHRQRDQTRAPRSGAARPARAPDRRAEHCRSVHVLACGSLRGAASSPPILLHRREYRRILHRPAETAWRARGPMGTVGERVTEAGGRHPWNTN